VSNIENIMKAYNCTSSSNVNATLPTYEDARIQENTLEKLEQAKIIDIV
jgi:hypothetical protein